MSSQGTQEVPKADSQVPDPTDSSYTRSLFEAAPDPLVAISPSGKITAVNAAAELLTGVARRDLIGTDFASYFTDPGRARDGFEEVLAKGSVRDHALALRHTSGKITEVLYSASVYKDPWGSVLGVVAATRDITELGLSLLHARRLIEASLDPLVTISPKGKVTDVNRATELATGISREQLIGTDFADIFTDPEMARAGYTQAFAKGSVRDYPLTIRRKSGLVMNVLYNASVYKDDKGVVLGVFAAVRDVTERKKLEEEQFQLASIVQSSVDAIIGTSPSGTIMSWNPSAEALFEYSAAEIIGKPITRLIPIERLVEEQYIMERAGRNERVAPYETERIRKDGTRVAVSLTVSPVKDLSGKIVGVSKIARDITDRKTAEERQRIASAYARSLIEASLDPLVTISPDGKTTDVNRATELVTGVPRDQLLGMDFADHFTEPVKARAWYTEALAKGAIIDYPLSIRHASGRVTEVLYNAAVYRDLAGNVQGVLATARDVTKLKEAERVVGQRADELARSNQELETFSYSISHDLRAPLRALEGLSRALLADYAGALDDTGRDYLQRLVTGAQRMDQLIQDILDYSRLGQRRLEIAPIDLKSVMTDVQSNLEAVLIERGAGLIVAPDLPSVNSDRVLITRIITNFVANGTKFVAPGVKPVVRVYAEPKQGAVRIWVADNGIGIAPEHQGKIWGVFERLHGTETYPGTGIGLAIVRRAAGQLGGSVGVESAAGQGSRFWLELPTAGAAP